MVNDSVVPVLAALARGVLGEGYDSDVPQRMLDTIGRVAAESDRKQVLSTLRLLNRRSGALALTGRAVPVSWLTPTEADELIRRWKLSRLPLQRRFAGLIIVLALSALYGHSAREWERFGYSGPLERKGKGRRFSPLSVEDEGSLSCDVVVVGSGPGGGCVASVLAGAGLDVVVVEKGGYFPESEFPQSEPDALANLYLYGMTLATTDLGCRIIAGSTLGGGAVVNYTTSFRTPPFVLRQWHEISGVDAFTNGEIDQSLDEVSEKLNVNTDSSAAGKRDELMEEGLKKLGWHVDLLPRAVRGCTQDEACGYCGFGCRVGAKTGAHTYLEEAVAAGARIVTGADVRRILVEGGKAEGVVVEANGRSAHITARAVVVAGGSIESPALLLRSGLKGQVGYNLHLHPGTAAFGMFPDDVRIWEGTTQARYSSEFRGWDDDYGPIFETVPAHPGAGSAGVIPWISASDHRTRMERYANISFCGVLPRDRSSGRVRLGRDGTPRVEYKLNEGDVRRITEGLINAAKVLEAAGAEEVYSPHSLPISYRTGIPGEHDRWADEVRARGLGRGQVTFLSYHQMGSCRMGVDPKSSAIGPDNETHEVKDLFVADASTFPTASGVNPMLSVFGIAHRAAKKIAARLA